MVLLLLGLFIMKLTTEGLGIKFFNAGISLSKELLFQGLNVPNPKSRMHSTLCDGFASDYPPVWPTGWAVGGFLNLLGEGRDV
jgi:hypothetical protein